MAISSLIGLGLVLIIVSLLTSILLGGSLIIAQSRLRVFGPWAERRAATFVLMVPPLFGLGVAVTVVAINLIAYTNGTDHCLDHSHHLHLCPIHGTQWIFVPWAVPSVAFFSTYLIMRIGRSTWAHVAAQLLGYRLKQTAEQISGVNRVYLVPNDQKFAFTTGIFSPIIIVSVAAWQALDTKQRMALVAHEKAHIVHGDLWKRATLGLLAYFGMPFVSQRALEIWDTASEGACDLHAVDRVGKPSIVASAIVSLAHSTPTRQVPTAALSAVSGNITDRVQALFTARASGKLVASRLSVTLAMVSVFTSILCVLFAESLHHLIETILG